MPLPRKNCVFVEIVHSVKFCGAFLVSSSIDFESGKEFIVEFACGASLKNFFY